MILKRDSFTFILISMSHLVSFLRTLLFVRARNMPRWVRKAPPVLSGPGCPGSRRQNSAQRTYLPRSVYKTATQHCATLVSFYVIGGVKKNRNVYQHTAIEQRYGCKNRTRIDLCERFASFLNCLRLTAQNVTILTKE